MAGTSENDHGAVISWSCLVQVRAGAAYKNECAKGKVEVANHVHMLLLELAGGGEAAGEDAVMDGSKVGWMFLELAGTGDKEVLG